MSGGGAAFAGATSGFTSPYYPASAGNANGSWYTNLMGLSAPISSQGQNNVLFFQFPYFSGPSGISIDQLDCYVATIGDAAAVVRAGVYTITNQTNPFAWVTGVKYADLLLDAGTRPTGTATGPQDWALGPLVIPPNTWFSVAGVDQAPTTLPFRYRWVSVKGGADPWGLGGSFNYSANNQVATALYQTGVSGPLPAAFIPALVSYAAYDAGIGFHRSS